MGIKTFLSSQTVVSLAIRTVMLSSTSIHLQYTNLSKWFQWPNSDLGRERCGHTGVNPQSQTGCREIQIFDLAVPYPVNGIYFLHSILIWS